MIHLVNDVIYSRDVSGRELAIYENGSIDQWNIYGMDNIGFIDGNEDIRFYMKDHLGSIRAVIDVSGNVVSSQDYDAWGYLLENRVYDSDVSVYKFTSKERDDESFYDYFGARYYDARVGRWGQVEPLLEKYLTTSPYSYALLNPLRLFDVNGMDVDITGSQVTGTYYALVSALPNLNLAINNGRLSHGEISTKLSAQELAFINAIDNPEVLVTLKTTKSNFINTGSVQHENGKEPLIVGRYMGSKMNKEIVDSKNIFNLSQVKIWSEAGGSSPGKSAMHEIIEAYFGGLNYPGTSYEESFTNSHNKTVALENPPEFYPGIDIHAMYLDETQQTVRISYVKLLDKNKKEHVLFDTREK
jgi:RHS repeat-associated protein